MSKVTLGTAVHEFSSPAGVVNNVPIMGWEATEEAPGGFISCSGQVTQDVVRDHPDVFCYGATWKVSLAETGETIWAGRLLDPTPQSLDAFHINAKGWGTLADRIAERLLYQTRSTDEWSPADEEPHKYTNDQKHEQVDGTSFTGGTTNAEVSTEIVLAETETATYSIPGGPLDDGQTYTFSFYGRAKEVKDETERIIARFELRENGSTIRTIEHKIDHAGELDEPKSNDHLATLSWVIDTANTYSVQVTVTQHKGTDRLILSGMRYGKTADITSHKIEARITGRRLIWKVARGQRFRGGEATGLIFWAPANPLSRLAFSWETNRHSDHFVLELCGATGPRGDLTVLETWGLTREDKVTSEGVREKIIRGDYDQIMLRLKRKEGAESKKGKKFKLSLSEVRVSAIAETDDWTVSDVVRDLAGRMRIDDFLVKDSSEPVLPLDVQEQSFADVLTDIHLLNDRRWLILDFGNGPVMDSARWDARHWTVFGTDAKADLVPVERYDQVRYPYRYPGGVRAWDVARPDDDPLPKGVLNSYTLSIDDPLPGKEVMEVFAQSVADYMCRDRAGGSADVWVVRDEQGLEWSAHHVHAGDTITFGTLRRTLRIKSVRRTDRGVNLTFDDSHALVDQLLARRSQRLAMGRSVADATLADVAPERPEAPILEPLTFRIREVTNGVRYKAVADWFEINSTTDGQEVDVDKYVAQLRPMVRATDVASLPANTAENRELYPTDSVVWRSSDETWHISNGSTSGSLWDAVPGTVDRWTDPDGGANPHYLFPYREPNEGHVQKSTVRGREDEDGNDVDPPTRAVFENIDKPNKWYYQFRARGIDVFNKQGRWSDWSDPVKPVAAVVNTIPPTPQNHFLDFDRLDRQKGTNPLRAVITYDELPKWDIPGGDHDSDLRGVQVQFRRVKANGTVISDAVQSRFIPTKRDDDADTLVKVVFHQVQKQYYYQYRLRSIAEYGQKGDWVGGANPGNWSDPETPSDTTRPSGVVSGAVFLDIDPHKAHVRYAFPQETDDDGNPLTDQDGDPLRDRDAHHAAVRLERQRTDNSWETVEEDNVVRGEHKVFRITKPRAHGTWTGNWRAKVVILDGAGNRSHTWAGAPTDTASLADPDQPLAPTIAFDVPDSAPRGRRIMATVTVTDASGFPESHIEGYQVQLQVSRNTTFGANDRRFKQFVPHVEDTADDSFTAVFFGIHRNFYTRARYRIVAEGGQRSPWSPWTAAEQAQPTVTVPPPTNVYIRKAVDQVGLDWDGPDDGNDADLIDIAVDYYQVQGSKDNTWASIWKKDRRVTTTKKLFHSEDYDTLHYFRVRAIDADGNKSDWRYGVIEGGSTSQTVAPGDGRKPRPDKDNAFYTLPNPPTVKTYEKKLPFDRDVKLRRHVVECDTAPSGGALEVRLKKNGTAVTGSSVSIAAGNTRGSVTLEPPVAVASTDNIKIEVVSVNSANHVSGKVVFWGDD